MKPFSISSLSKCKFEFVKSVRCYHNLAPGVIIVCLFTHLFRWNHVLKATLLKYFFTDNDCNNNINYVAKIFWSLVVIKSIEVNIELLIFVKWPNCGDIITPAD